MASTHEIASREGLVSGAGRRFGLVASRFNEGIVDRLVGGATETLLRHGVASSDVELFRVPGAWEIPQILRLLAEPGRGFAALIALGAVIRGETPHFEYICRHCADGSAAVARDFGLPVAFGVLTCDTAEQAEDRAGGRVGNKGNEAALAALEMADLVARLRQG